jgi:hypothetical protein
MLSWHSIRRPLAVVAFYALLGAIFLAPLIFHLATWVPGGPATDFHHFNWNFWWTRRALQTGQDPYYTEMVLAPFRHNLAMHTPTSNWLPFYLVAEPLIGQLRSTNLMIWLTVLLTGAITYHLLRRQHIRPALALLGGTIFAFSPYMRHHTSATHLNLFDLFWLPLMLMLWERVATAGSIRQQAIRAVVTGLALWGVWMTDLHALLQVALILGPYALLTLVQAADLRARARLAVLGAAGLAITLALAWFIAPLQAFLAFDRASVSPAGSETFHHYAIPLKAFLLQPGGEDRSIGVLLVPLTVLALAVPSKDQMRWFWLATAVLSFVLALGPDVQISGVTVPLPFRLLDRAFGGQFRTPARVGPPGMLALIVFLARTYDPALRRLRPAVLRRAVPAALLVAFLVDFDVFKPFPTFPAPPMYAFYERIRHEDADIVILEVPVGIESGWKRVGEHPEAMFYGITHEKRMINGFLARIPDDWHLYYEQSYLLGWLAGVRPLDADRASSELVHIVEGDWPGGRTFAPVGYVVVHQNWLSRERALEILRFLNGQPALCYLETERDAVLFRARTHPAGCPPRIPPETAPGVYTVDFGQTGDEGFIGHGWYWPEEIGGTRARWGGGQHETLFHASLPPGASYTLALRAVAFAGPRTITVVVGDLIDGKAQGTRLGEFTVAPGAWDEYSVTIPADLIARVNGDLVISLTADGMASAAELGLSRDARPLTVAYDRAQFRRVDGE